jgi:hypothetical protein
VPDKVPPAVCPCTDVVAVTVEWECSRRHRGYAALCQTHGAIHVAALMSGGIMCGRCREEDGRERAVTLRRVNGKKVSARLGRTQL